MDAATTVLLLSFAVAVVLGWAIAQTDYCSLGGVADWVNFGDRGRFGAWLWAMALAMLGVAALEATAILNVLDSRIPYAASAINPLRHIVGGPAVRGWHAPHGRLHQ